MFGLKCVKPSSIYIYLLFVSVLFCPTIKRKIDYGNTRVSTRTDLAFLQALPLLWQHGEIKGDQDPESLWVQVHQDAEWLLSASLPSRSLSHLPASKLQDKEKQPISLLCYHLISMLLTRIQGKSGLWMLHLCLLRANEGIAQYSQPEVWKGGCILTA